MVSEIHSNNDDINSNLKNNKNENTNKIKIIGFGNLLMGDDGIGIKVINTLREKNIFSHLNKDIEILDGGTSGFDLVFLVKDAQKVVIIDAVDAGQQVGEVVVFRPENVKEFFKKKAVFKSYSLHDLDLTDIFELLKTLELKTEIRIIGIKPKKVGYSDKISPEIENKLDQIISIVKKEVEDLAYSG